MEDKAPHSLAYGFWRYGPDELETAIRMLEAARAEAITHFDAADVYGGRENFGAAETLLGEVRAKAPSLLEGAEIATKVGVEYGTPYNSSKEYVGEAVNASLRRLKREQIDLIYIHRPDMLAHAAEVAEALDKLVAGGKARSIGVSNYVPSQIDALTAYLKAPLAAHQIEFSALQPAPLFDGTTDQAMMRKITLYAWSPLAGGRVLESGDERAVRLRAALEEIAAERRCAVSVIAFAFIMRHPASITPVLGTKSIDRLREAAGACRLILSRAEWYRILEASLGRKMP